MNKTNKFSLSSLLFPQVRDFLFAFIFFLVIYTGPHLFGDGDPGRHITYGGIILQQHTIPTQDFFSYSLPGAAFVPHEWLAALLYTLAYKAMGFNGMVLLAAALITTAFTIVFHDALKRGAGHLLTLGIVLLAAITSIIHWQVRPHLFTYVMLAIWVALLHRLVNNKPIAIWYFPVIMLSWANTHGGFMTGFLIWGAYLAGTLWDYLRASEKPAVKTIMRLLIAGGLSFAVTFINPAGWRLWAATLGHLQNKYLMNLTLDARSTDFHNPLSIPFLLLIALTIFLLARPRKNAPTTSEAFLLAGCTIMGLYSSRNIEIFAFVSAPILATYIQPEVQQVALLEKLENQIANLQKQLRGIVWPLLIIVIIAGLLISGQALDSQKQGNGFLPKVFPVEAVNWLEQNPQEGNVFNYYSWGGYLIYRLWPDTLVFIDGETMFYGEDLSREYLAVEKLEDGWQGILLNYHVSWVLMPSDSLLIAELEQTGWNMLYTDETATILRRP
jgi:hypothetical protein